MLTLSFYLIKHNFLTSRHYVSSYLRERVATYSFERKFLK